MKKGKDKKKFFQWSSFISVALLVIVGIGYLFYSESIPTKRVEAFDIITNGNFALRGYNQWDNSDSERGKKNLVELDWDEPEGLTQSGYKLYQREQNANGTWTEWENRSMNYRKSIKVLNVYPDIAASNTLQGWMNSLNLRDDSNNNLIQVTPVRITDFNANPDRYLRNQNGEYQYDVIMFGSWDGNDSKDISDLGAEKTVEFIESGRGVLFGHDTVHKVPNNNAKRNWWRYFHTEHDYLGIGHDVEMERENGAIQARYNTGSTKVRITNDGYLMKFPFEMENQLILTIPASHNIELSDKSTGTIWAEFTEPYSVYNNPPYDDENWRGGWYLKTNNNVAMIQTGHSNGRSSEGEQQIIANVLYNLAQVSLDNSASDDSVSDKKAPNAPIASIRCGSDDALNIKMNAEDIGTPYRFKVTADTRSGEKTSNEIQETVVSNIAGYFYRVNESANFDLKAEVEGLKDARGRVPQTAFGDGLYVAPTDPENHTLTYETATSITISERNTSGKYLHVVAVDRANNVSAVTSQQINRLTQPIDFEVERTGDEAILADLVLHGDSINSKMQSLEIQIPKNTAIKDFDSIRLPNEWTVTRSETNDYYSFKFSMNTNNGTAAIRTFLEERIFVINNPVNTPGSIKLILHENDKEINDVCWSAAIPQKVILQGYSERFGQLERLEQGDITYDKQLRIGGAITAQPKDLELYEFLEFRERHGDMVIPGPRPLEDQYTITSDLQEGAVIYENRQIKLNVRQVVLDPNDALVNPNSGYLNVKTLPLDPNSHTHVEDPRQLIQTHINSQETSETPVFEPFVFSTKHMAEEDHVRFTLNLPEFYEYVGYYWTVRHFEDPNDPMGADHQNKTADDLSPGQLETIGEFMDMDREYFISLYIRPTAAGQTPQPYSWDYKKNDLGLIRPERP